MASRLPTETGHATLTRAAVAEDEIFCDGIAVRTIIRCRELRAKLLPADWFCDPAWDLLLRLYQAHADRRAITMGELIDLTQLKATTASRWINVIAEKGWATRSRCSRDHRRVFVRLTESGVEAMERYFEALRS